MPCVKLSMLHLHVERVAVCFFNPIVITLSGLGKYELPDDEFIVVHIERLSINDDIDPRNREVGYM